MATETDRRRAAVQRAAVSFTALLPIERLL